MMTQSDPTKPSHLAKLSSSLNARLALGGAVLLVEYLLISYAFDAKSVASRGGIWTVVGEVGNVGPLVVAGAAACLLAPELRQAAAARTGAGAAPSAPILILHLGACAAFSYVTAAAFGPKGAPPGPAILWMLAWSGLGMATAVSLFLGILGELRWLTRSLRRALVVGGMLGSAAWFGGTLSTELWLPLARFTFHAVSAVLGTFGLELYTRPGSVVIELEGFSVAVAAVCSGSEGIGLYVVLMSLFLYQSRRILRFPHTLLMLPVGIAVVWFGNVARIASLMIVGARLDEKIAVGSFHSKAGWVFFSAITLVLAVITLKVAFFKRETSARVQPISESPATPLLLPMLCWIAIGLGTSLFSDQHDPLYGLRVVVTGGVLVYYRRELLTWLQKPQWPAWTTGLVVGIAWLATPMPGTTRVEPAAAHWSTGLYLSWLFLRCAGAILVIPICEELAFRGYLARWLSRRRAFWELPPTGITWLGAVGSSLAFGALHGRWILGTAAGLVFAILVRRSGRLIDAIVAHSVSNTTIALWVLVTGDWRHWQ